MKFLRINTALTIPIFAVLVAVIVISACKPATPAAPETPRANGYPPPPFIASQDCDDLRHGVLPLADLTISGGENDITVQVEVADEATEHSQGLMCRDVIPPGTGMLFTYDSDRSSGFWMFNTYAPIDILYLDQSGRVVDNIAMSPCTRNTAKGSDADDDWNARCVAEAKTYVPSGPWRNTLELPAGWLQDRGLGDPVGLEVTISWTALGD